MDKFLVLDTFTDQGMAEVACTALEEASIPVMLEHVTINDELGAVYGFRIMAPANFSQAATILLKRIKISHTAQLSKDAVGFQI